MLRSLSNHSPSRVDTELNASSNNSVTSSSQYSRSIYRFRNYQLAKRAVSLILHKPDSEIGNARDDNEMYEFVRHTTSEENINTIHRSEPTTVGDTIIDRSRRGSRINTTCGTPSSLHRKFSQIKKKISSHRHERTSHSESDREKNDGYLVVEKTDADLIFIPNENIGQQTTQHAQPCIHGQIHDDNFDVNQIQGIPTTPITPNLLHPQQPFLGFSITAVDSASNNELEALLTRSSVECGVPQSDLLNVQDTYRSLTLSTSSPSSTNSSNNEYNGIDRSTLDDTEYIRAQRLDLERLTMFEIETCRDRRLHEQDFNSYEEDELEFNRAYDEAEQDNFRLNEDLKTLQEECDRIYSEWSCELCTYTNKAYIETRRDVCEMCESPSPIKRITLIK